MTKARNLADLLNADGQIDNADIAGGVNFKNIIINGDMSIAQRGTSTTGVTGGNYTVDRYRYSKNGTSPTLTVSQDTDVPSNQGFSKSLKLEVTTVNAVASSDRGFLEQRFEGQNLQYLKKGTSSAESLTASFWVKASVTGTYIVFLLDTDNTRQIAKSYTINTADTWEKKTITFAGDTSGTLDNDNAESLSLNFGLYAGTDYTSGTLQTSWGTRVDANQLVGQVDTFATVNNTWQITGVQLEAGTTASDFEFLPVDVNLERCHRYYYLMGSGGSLSITNGSSYNGNTAYGVILFKTEMRTAPSLDQASGTNFYIYYSASVARQFDSFSFAGNVVTNKSARINNAQAITTTGGHGGWFQANDANSYVAMDAEL